jgi:hypothetical protein
VIEPLTVRTLHDAVKKLADEVSGRPTVVPTGAIEAEWLPH